MAEPVFSSNHLKMPDFLPHRHGRRSRRNRAGPGQRQRVPPGLDRRLLIQRLHLPVRRDRAGSTSSERQSFDPHTHRSSARTHPAPLSRPSLAGTDAAGAPLQPAAPHASTARSSQAVSSHRAAPVAAPLVSSVRASPGRRQALPFGCPRACHRHAERCPRSRRPSLRLRLVSHGCSLLVVVVPAGHGYFAETTRNGGH